MIDPHKSPEGFIGALATVGALIGLGKLLASNDRITPRVILGRAFVSGGLGACAGAASLLFPDASPVVMYGLAAAAASAGTSAVEGFLNRRIGGAAA